MPGSTYNILVLGDSITWGQGLQLAEKFHELVRVGIAQRKPGVTVQSFVSAHSGAPTRPDPRYVSDPLVSSQVDPVNCSAAIAGEVPTGRPSASEQAAAFTGPPAPEQIDLILMDGGSNDVGIGDLVNPWKTPATLQGAIDTGCHDRMVQTPYGGVQEISEGQDYRDRLLSDRQQ